MIAATLVSIICWVSLHKLVSGKSSYACYSHTEPLPEAMSGHIGIHHESSNTVYLFGGKGIDGNYVNTVYKWDRNKKNSWFKSIGNTPTSIFYSYANNGVLIGNIVWFIGMDDDDFLYTGNIHQFDTTTDSWLNTSNLSKPIIATHHGCLSSNKTHIFMVDGYTGSESRRPVMQIYNIADDKWTIFYIFDESMIFDGGWRYQYCSMIDTKLYIMGGKVTDSGYDDDIDIYDTMKHSYTKEAGGTLPSDQAYGVAVYYNDLIYLVGSFPYPINNNIHVFNLKNDKVINLAYTNTQPISVPAAMVLDNNLWIFGGEDSDFDSVSNVEICNLDPPSG